MRVEVLVAIEEYAALPDEMWDVLVYPEGNVRRGGTGRVSPDGFDETIEPVSCNYHYMGWPHDIRRPIGSAGPLENAAVCFLRETSVRCDESPGTGRFMQRAGDHEVGHMLGMLHPGGICNQRLCYGATDGQRSRIMGAGHDVTVRDYTFATTIMDSFSHARVGQRIWRLEPDRRSAGVSTCW